MSGGDPFGALRDDLVLHVLSFLPSRDAVKSSVFSRRWRDLWRSTPAVRVRGHDDGFCRFVNSLLLQRDGNSPLREFEIETDLSIGGGGEDSDYEDEDCSREIHPYVDQWIRRAVVTCRAASLTARFPDEDTLWSPRQRRPFASPHLTTMHLDGVRLADGLIDFSCCPALLHLSLTACRLDAGAFVSPSLERLSIIDCDIIQIGRNAGGRSRMGIYTPSLRYLQLSDNVAQGFPKAPSLESMPWLKNASIQLTGYLACNPPQEILLRDLKWCPTFTKLKTLILNEWCVYAEVTAFVCLLRHTPGLENLILQLPFKNLPKLDVKVDENHTTSEQPFLTLEHLKAVEIKNCRPSYYFSKRLVFFTKSVEQIMKLFSDWGIPSSKISINYKQPEGQPSTCT
uniref:Uncharacterized protein n=1 Tax=Avena sativa TaxID=4498 RepID=A0ACD6AG52_AVESA